MKPYNATHRKRISYIFIAGGSNQLNGVNRELAADFYGKLHGLQPTELIKQLRSINDVQGAEDQAKFFLTLVLAHPDMFHFIMSDSFDQGRRLGEGQNEASYLMGAILGLMEVLDDIQVWPNYGEIKGKLPEMFASAFIAMSNLVPGYVFSTKVTGALSNSIGIFLRHVSFWEFMLELDVQCKSTDTIEIASLAEYILKEVISKFAHSTGSMGRMVRTLAQGHLVMTKADTPAD